jgi:hypothetical protein
MGILLLSRIPWTTFPWPHNLNQQTSGNPGAVQCRHLKGADLMTAFVRYRIYGWIPPDLSVEERMVLGEAIVRVGRKQFVASLKRRLSPPLHMTKAEQFSFQDVLYDVEKGLPVRAKLSVSATLFALAFFAGCIWLIASTPRLLTSFLVTMAIILPISMGSLLLMNRKIDQWVNEIADDFAKEILRGGKLGR